MKTNRNKVTPFLLLPISYFFVFSISSYIFLFFLPQRLPLGIIGLSMTHDANYWYAQKTFTFRTVFIKDYHNKLL